MRPAGPSSIVCAALLSVVPLACSEKNNVDKPEPPGDIDPIVYAYAHPTLELTPQTVLDTVTGQEVISATMNRLTESFPQVVDAVDTALNADGEADQIGASGDGKSRPINVTGSGFLIVKRICPGWEPDAAPDEKKNGLMDLTVNFTEAGIDPVVWGDLRSCRFLVADEYLTLHGSIQLHVGENLKFDGFGTTPIVTLLRGTLQVGDATEGSLDVDFRLLPSGVVEYRVFVGDEFVVYWDRVTERGFRAANGTFSCNFEAKQCQGDAGDSVVW